MGKLLTRRAGSRGLGSVTLVAVAMLAGAVAAACAPGSASDPGRIAAVGAESEYANVITQIGGPYVAVSAVMSNPNIDPHTYEASPQVAQTVSTAQLVVQNGAGYDGFMETIEVATPSSTRRVIDVQSLLGLPATTENPHLWYSPATMPAVAKAIGKDLAALAPSHEAYFTAEVAAFDTSLAPWTQAIAALKSSFSGGDHRAGGRLHAPGCWARQPDPVALPGRRHERGRSVRSGREPRAGFLHGSPGQGLHL
jgi:zinc/manganese transport system substrate-binding protein